MRFARGGGLAALLRCWIFKNKTKKYDPNYNNDKIGIQIILKIEMQIFL